MTGLISIAFVLAILPHLTACGSNNGNAIGNGGTSGLGGAAATGGDNGIPDEDDAGGGADGGGNSVTADSFCASIMSRVVSGASVTRAVLMPAASGKPQYCLVVARIGNSLNFQVALPNNWNHRILFIGGGGFDGVIPDITASLSPGTLANGYAVVVNDSGHQSNDVFDGSWALNNADPDALVNFGYLSTHTVLPVARSIVNMRYASPGDRVYFEGCSNGGREALIAAERWPNDFDGIIARAPACNFTGNMTAFHKNAQLVNAPGGMLTPGKLATLARAELTACDGADGVSDGIISNPFACQFEPATLRCAGNSSDACLTDAEVATINGIRADTPLGYSQMDSITAFPGWPIGHEDVSWPVWIIGNSPPSLQFVLQDQFIKFFVTQNVGADSLQTLLSDNAGAMAQLSQLLDATSSDLSQFSGRGGKLILWHGLADAAISATATVQYYQRLVAKAGGQLATDQFARFYTAPGVEHCGWGPGADSVDLVTALDAWVRQGSAPDSLVATHVDSNSQAARLTRPLCAYPQYPRYTGSGDANLAVNYTCATP
jgi:pimeloyl-ACP methyl ester carboxylesterase